jgi:hypothetical protein
MTETSLEEEVQGHDRENISGFGDLSKLERFFVKPYRHSSQDRQREVGRLDDVSLRLREPTYDPDTLTRELVTDIDEGLMKDIEDNIPRWLKSYTPMILAAARSILSLKGYIENFKWRKSQENGDIGYHNAVRKFLTQEDEKFKRIIFYNSLNPVNLGVCDRKSYNGFLNHLLMGMGNNGYLKEMQEQMNGSSSNKVDKLSVIPSFLQTWDFSFHILESMNYYCNNKCSYEPHCVTATILPGRDGQRAITSENYFG